MGLEVDGIIGDSTYMKLMGKRMPQYAGYGVSRGRSYRGSGAARRLISRAFEYVGVPYVFGGTTPWGFDCSGYTQYVFRQIGISIPRTADTQYYSYPKVSSRNLQPGDLVFLKRMNRVPPMSGSILATARCFRLVPVQA